MTSRQALWDNNFHFPEDIQATHVAKLIRMVKDQRIDTFEVTAEAEAEDGHAGQGAAADGQGGQGAADLVAQGQAAVGHRQQGAAVGQRQGAVGADGGAVDCATVVASEADDGASIGDGCTMCGGRAKESEHQSGVVDGRVGFEEGYLPPAQRAELKKVVDKLRLAVVQARIRGASPEEIKETEKALRDGEEELQSLSGSLAAKPGGPLVDLDA